MARTKQTCRKEESSPLPPIPRANTGFKQPRFKRVGNTRRGSLWQDSNLNRFFEQDKGKDFPQALEEFKNTLADERLNQAWVEEDFKFIEFIEINDD